MFILLSSILAGITNSPPQDENAWVGYLFATLAFLVYPAFLVAMCMGERHLNKKLAKNERTNREKRIVK